MRGQEFPSGHMILIWCHPDIDTSTATQPHYDKIVDASTALGHLMPTGLKINEATEFIVPFTEHIKWAVYV